MKAKPCESGTTSKVPIPVLSQEHLTTIFNASHDVVFVLDGESKTILHVNDTVERVLGYAPDTLFGAQFPALVAESAPDYLEHCQFFDGVFGPVSFRRSDGALCQGDVTAAVIPWYGVPALLYTLRDATQRTALEEEKAALIHDLQQALSTVQRLSGLLPICANCKRIRDDEGYWETVEEYIGSHSGAHFSHSICPACRDELYPGLEHVPLAETSAQREDIDGRFFAAQEILKAHRATLDRITQLRLYALQQQGTLGDYVADHIDFTDGAFRARIDGWKALRGTPMEKARVLYVELVEEIANAGEKVGKHRGGLSNDPEETAR